MVAAHDGHFKYDGLPRPSKQRHHVATAFQGRRPAWAAAPLLAQASPWQHMGRQFREGGSTFGPADLLLLAAVLGGVFLLLWLLSKLAQRGDRPPCHSRWGLFVELCRAHRLSCREIWLLWKLARAQRLAQPAKLFLTPECFSPPRVPPALRPRTADLAALSEKLFAAPEK